MLLMFNTNLNLPRQSVLPDCLLAGGQPAIDSYVQQLELRCFFSTKLHLLINAMCISSARIAANISKYLYLYRYKTITS